jgi:hypothetical protein
MQRPMLRRRGYYSRCGGKQTLAGLVYSSFNPGGAEVCVRQPLCATSHLRSEPFALSAPLFVFSSKSSTTPSISRSSLRYYLTHSSEHTLIHVSINAGLFHSTVRYLKF